MPFEYPLMGTSEELVKAQRLWLPMRQSLAFMLFRHHALSPFRLAFFCQLGPRGASTGQLLTLARSPIISLA
ncbi:MFS transporter prlL [Fusarium oxysporum f. sp. albedinis]|nr:MFS transporter prlL [Fusarium oxysporum f. sp. albedinis]